MHSSLSIHHFHVDHNGPCLPPRTLHKYCFQFLLGITVIPREIKGNGYAKFGGRGWGRGGGGLTRCILRVVELIYSVFQGEESVKEARRLLEFAEETVYVSRPLVGESNKKQTVREVGWKVNACRTKFQNLLRRSPISHCYSTKSYSMKKLLSKSFHLNGHTSVFHPQSQTLELSSAA